MVLLSIFFTRIRSTEGSSADCSLFILSLHALALHLAVKILLRLSVWRFEHVKPYITSVGYFLRMPAGPHFVTQPILLSENIPNIWHKSSTKHKEVRPGQTIKTIMQTTRPRITWKVLPMAQLPFWNIRSNAKRFRLWIVLFWTKTSQRLTYIYYLATDNIHIVLKTITPC